jgi:hypothetical protein
MFKHWLSVSPEGLVAPDHISFPQGLAYGYPLSVRRNTLMLFAHMERVANTEPPDYQISSFFSCSFPLPAAIATSASAYHRTPIAKVSLP